MHYTCAQATTAEFRIRWRGLRRCLPRLLLPTAPDSCLGLEANSVFILVALAFANSLNAYSRRASRLSSTVPTTKSWRKINEEISDAACVFVFDLRAGRILRQHRHP